MILSDERNREIMHGNVMAFRHFARKLKQTALVKMFMAF